MNTISHASNSLVPAHAQRRLRVIVVTALLCTPVVLFSAENGATTPKREAEVNLTPGPKATPELLDAVLRADHDLFTAVFDTCDLGKLQDLVTDDFEFFHDKGGLVSTSGAQFIEDIDDKCVRQREGIDFLSRRELVKESVKVYPLNKYGAIETGMHRFYAISAGKPDRLTEVSRFTHVWKEENGKWRLARVLSYDHQLAE